MFIFSRPRILNREKNIFNSCNLVQEALDIYGLVYLRGLESSPIERGISKIMCGREGSNPLEQLWVGEGGGRPSVFHWIRKGPASAKVQ